MKTELSKTKIHSFRCKAIGTMMLVFMVFLNGILACEKQPAFSPKKLSLSHVEIPDAVNTASRMEGLTKVFGGSVILVEKTLDALPEDHGLRYRYLGMIKVKGKDVALKIYDFYEGDGDEQKC